MPRKKSNNNNYKIKILGTLKSKYPHFLTGFLIILILIVSISKIYKPKTEINLDSLKSKEQPKTTEIKQQIHTYIVQKGDHLWKIAEAAYGSGFNGYDIAKANKIENPSMIFAGQKLILPDVEIKTPTTGEIAKAKTEQVVKKIDKYTVQKGDHLWKIATATYGDGMAWVRIAKANKIENPDLIFAGQVLKIE